MLRNPYDYFGDFAEGFVSVCHKHGLGEQQTADLLKQATPSLALADPDTADAFVSTLEKHAFFGELGHKVRESFDSHVDTAKSNLAGMGVSPQEGRSMMDEVKATKLPGIGEAAGLFAAPYVQKFRSIVSAPKRWVQNYTNPMGYRPSYLDDETIRSSNGKIDIANTGPGRRASALNQELRDVETRLAELRRPKASPYEAAMAARDGRQLERRRKEILNTVNKIDRDVVRDQARWQDQAKKRMQVYQEEMEALKPEMERLNQHFSAETQPGLSGWLRSLLGSLANTDQYYEDIAGRQAELQAQLERDRRLSELQIAR